MDDTLDRLCQAMIKRTGGLKDTGMLALRHAGDPPVIDELLGNVRLSLFDQKDGYYCLNVALVDDRFVSARPGRILYNKSTHELRARAPRPTDERKRLVNYATTILYNDIQNP